MTTFTEIPTDKITAHPKNVRRHVEADEDMVESIKAHGIITAITVVPDDDGYYQLIGGHRRLDGAKKAGVALIPAMVRDDLVTDAEHIEAMAIENLHREDLTAIEEAAGYQQLELLGYSTADIAKKTGRTATTVAARMKLNSLHDAAKDAVHGHQITLEEASQLLYLEERPKLLKEVETTLGTDEFNWKLRSAVNQAKREAEDARCVAECEASGLPRIKIKTDQYYYNETGPRPPREGEVADAWGIDRNGRALFFIKNPPKPPKRVKSDEEIANDLRWKKEQEARKALEQKQADARDLRVEHVVAAAAAVKIPVDVLNVVRLGLGAALATRQPADVKDFASTAGVELTRGKAWRDSSLVTQVQDLPAQSVVALLVSLVTHDAEALIVRATHSYGPDDLVDLENAVQYFDALEQLGYTFPAIDRKARTAITKKATTARAKADKKTAAA